MPQLRNMALAVLVAAGLVGGLQAKTLYVNNSGSPSCSDATTYSANSASSPWCSIGRAAWGSTSRASPNAAQAAAAGDTVLISAGNYTTTSNVTRCGGVRWEVALNPANSGTAANPITFRGTGAVNIYLGAGYVGPTIGANTRNHIVWDNVRIDEQTAQGTSCADTGPVVFFMCTGCKLLNTTIRGTNRSWSDNYSAIRTEFVSGMTIANNRISDISGNWGENNAGWILYDTANTVFEHNYVYNSYNGIYVKGDHADGLPAQENITIRNNWFENNAGYGIFLLAGYNTRIYQNVIKNSRFGIRHYPNTTSNSIIANNTIIGESGDYSGYSVYVNPPTNLRFHNNIVVGAFDEAMNVGMLPVTGHSFEHNVYHGFVAFGSASGAIRSFATWRDTWGLDRAAPESVVQNPQFVSTSYPGGYRLAAGSPALARGVDLLDLNHNQRTDDIIPAGAYVNPDDVIGPLSPGQGGLSPPGNLRIVQ